MSQTVNSNDYYYVSVLNNGGYIAQFQFSYDLNGERVSVTVPDSTLGFTRVMSFPKGATNVYVEVHAFLFGATPLIFWNYVDTNRNTCYVVYGPIWGPQYYERNCNNDGALQASISGTLVGAVGGGATISNTPCNCCCRCNRNC